MEDCIFCKIVRGEIPAKKIYEDQDYLAFLNIAPNTKGHSLVIPKKHSDLFVDLSSEEVGALNQVVQKVAKELTLVLETKSFNLGLNNGELSGQSINHVHWHIIPRYQGDGLLHWEKSPQAEADIDQVFKILKDKIK
ncbi:HIT family protein [Candidatus Nomurabacteria bacterium]|nr:HIT family protein [Candidatus Nomurabacteria bacterium]